MYLHCEDKNVPNHIYLNNKDNLEFPAILVIADTYCNDERITLIPTYEAKDNTKYGINGDL